MSKVDRFNELLLHNLAIIVSQEVGIQNAVITLSYVDTSPDLKQAKIGFSVLPDHFLGSTLKLLRSNTGLFVKRLQERINLRQIPKFIWEFDASERNLAELDQVLIKEAKDLEQN